MQVIVPWDGNGGGYGGKQNQSESLSLGQIPAIDLAVSEAARVGAVALADGAVQGLRLGSEQQVVEKFIIPPAILGKPASNERSDHDEWRENSQLGLRVETFFVVSGLDDLTSVSDRVVTVAAHKRGITDICFGKDGTLWTASEDRSVRSWKQAPDGSLREEVVGWHFLPVRQIAIADQGRGTFLAAVVGDGRSGKVVVWEQVQQGNGSAFAVARANVRSFRTTFRCYFRQIRAACCFRRPSRQRAGLEYIGSVCKG